MNIVWNIAKLICGSDLQGTALLIDEKHAITVKHCVKDVYYGKTDQIMLHIFIDGKVKKVSASFEIKDNYESEEALVYLQLAENVENISKIRFKNYKPDVYQEMYMFGYGKYYPTGAWKQLKSIGRRDVIEDNIYDLQFETDAKDKTYVGYSGSPIFDKDKIFVVGLISQEEEVDHEIIYLEGISVKSQKIFFEKNGIEVEFIGGTERNIDKKPGTVQSEKFSVTGISDTVYELHDTILNEIVSLHHKGYHAEALEKIKEQIQLQYNDDTVSNDTKAKFLLQQAIWLLEDCCSISAANKSYKKAILLSESIDTRAFLALRAFYSGNRNARELTKPMDSLYMLNIYMQICVNQRDGKAAIEAYDTYKDIYQCDSNTWYILSIAFVLQRNFLKAEELINKAIVENDKVSDYYLIKGLIVYWRTVPEEVFYETDNIYPSLYSNGIYFFTNDMRTAIMDAVENFKVAYHRADSVGNKKSKEKVLGCWINALSIDNILFTKVEEPLRLLKKENPYHVIVLMVDILCDKVSRNEKYENQIMALIRKKDNTLGYVLVLAEYFVRIGENDKAKSLIFEYKELFKKSSNMEYWYGYVAQLESDIERKQFYAKMVNEEDTFTDNQKKRIVCLLTLNSKENELEGLELLYDETRENIDLMNIIWYCQKKKNWEMILKYAEVLVNKHHNPYGFVYKLKAYMNMRKFNDAYICIQEIERLSINELNEQIQVDKVIVFEKMGEYDRAIIEGEELFHRQQTEEFAHRLANLYIKKGKTLEAIRVLQTAEKNAPLSTIGYQRLSGYYRFVDSQKSLEYAKKSVEASNHSQDVLAWAVTNAAEIGMSNVMGNYWNELVKNHSDTNIFRAVSLEELLEMIRVENTHRREIEEKYNRAEIPLHILLDGLNNVLMSEVFYENWMDDTQFSLISFGGHYIEMCNMTTINKIVLDYTSCLFLQELQMLDVLAKHVSSIYIPSNMNPVILEEQDKLRSGQSDLLAHKKRVIDYCLDTLHLNCVEQVFPDNINDLKETERLNAVFSHTAKVNGALWIDVYRENENIITTNEVYAVLSEWGYPCEYDQNIVQLEKIEMLRNQGCKLLVNMLVLEEWYDKGILDDINALFEIILFNNEREMIEDESRSQVKKYEIYNKLELLKNTLSNLDSIGKLKWCFDTEQEGGKNKYSNLLISAISTAIQQDIPYCVEDRCMQSYKEVNNAPVYGVLDIIKIMHNQGWIDDNRYLNIYRKLINKKIGFIILDDQIIFRGLNTSSTKNGNLIESKLLSDIRVYVEESFWLVEKFTGIYRMGIHLIERNCYSIMHLTSIRKTIETIWLSNIELEKKRIFSNWVIFRYSRIGESLAVNDSCDLSEDILVIFPIFQLIYQGMLFASNIELIPEYYKWLFSLISYYLENNAILFDNVIKYLIKETYVILQDIKKFDEFIQIRFEQTISHGINEMPEYLRKGLLEDREILTVYNRYFVDAVSLNEDCYIPRDLFDIWYSDVLSMEENTEITRTYDGVEFTFSWKYILPLWPLLKVCWIEEDVPFSYQLYCEPGIRLKHDKTSVRIKEARKVYEYLGSSPDLDEIELLSTENYKETSDLLGLRIRMCDFYIKEQIHLLIKEAWLANMTAVRYFLPADVLYFKRLYDYENCIMCEDREIQSAIPIRMSEEYNCGKSLNPVRRLHYLSWIMQNDFEHDKNEFICMFEFLEGGSCVEYGRIYNALLKIIFEAMSEVKEYSMEPIQNRIIWTYIWVDKLYEELITQIQLKNLSLERYQHILCECEKEVSGHYDYSRELEAFDVIDPSQMGIMRICLLGSVELCLEYNGENKDKEIYDVAKTIEKNLKLWFGSEEPLLEFFVSHENAKNEWGTFFACNYRRELNKLQKLIIDVSEDKLLLESDIQELKRILTRESISDADKTVIFMVCLNKMDNELIDLLESILQKFYLDTDTLVEADDYALVEHVLLKLPEDYRNQFRKNEIIKLKNEFLSDNSIWKKIFDCLLHAVSNNPELCVEFWEKIADEIKEPVDPELVEWLTRLQLFLPLKLGRRLYQAKVQLINRKYKID